MPVEGPVVTRPPLATTDDVQDLWHAVTDSQQLALIGRLIVRASAALRQACPFDVDARIAQFGQTPPLPTALDPTIVATVIATIVKRFLVNPDGAASFSETIGQYSHAATYVDRFDKTEPNVRGVIQVTVADIDMLRPAQPYAVSPVIRLHPTRSRIPDAARWNTSFTDRLC